MIRKKLFLIDGQNLIYRAFYALPRLTNSKGVPTGAVYGFANMLLKIIKEEFPDYIAVVLDLPGPTFRHKIYKEYKGTRQKTPEELTAQIPLIKDIIKGFNISIIEKPGYEADDCIGTIATRAGRDFDVYIVTGDKDALQLVNDNVCVMNRKPDEKIVYNIEEVKSAFGVQPQAIVDILALAGDVSDNIPGVKGIGEKTAVKLIGQFGSIENLLKNLNEVPEVLAGKIKEHIEDVKLSKELVKIDIDVPLEVEIEVLKKKEPNNARLLELFTELEFSRLLKEVSSQGELFAVPEGQREEEPAKSFVEGASLRMESAGGSVKGEVIEKNEDLEILLSRIKKNKFLGFDLTTVHDPEQGRRVEICIVCDGRVYFLKDGNLFNKLKPLFESEEIEKIGYNLKEKIIVLRRNNSVPKGFDFDLTIASYLLEPERYSTELSKAIISWGEHSINPQMLNLFSLKEDLDTLLKKNELFDLFKNVEMPLIEVLAQMEIDGIKIDTDYLVELGKRLETDIGKISHKIYNLAGEEFNINSPKVLRQILFEKLKLPPDRKTKTGYSTDVDVLKKLAVKHELPANLLDYRQLTKLKSTYVDALPKLLNSLTGRVHTSFNQTGTVTGRLSSSEPNMQNIPVKTEIGREIRRVFIPEDGWLFISADYSQIELRVLAHLSSDENLVESFKQDEDIHLRTASEIFGLPIDKVNNSMRNRAKVVNFGIVYGMSSFGLSQELGISKDESQVYIDTYFLKYHGVARYIREILKDAGGKGYVRTLLGRIRYTPSITSQNRTVRQMAERTAINSPIQGTASDLIKLAMVNIYRQLDDKGLKTRILLQIHDELLFESPLDEVEQACKLIEKEMREVYKLKVPLKVDIKKGSNWRDLK
ncbi:DNA polymerase I [Candidatus Desantisbacteria bacterium CG1_02_38_46]|nr:MAG: DNA polymerase I [Candidatus Desantisbacteria bacterium CG1_02_38_46]